VALTFLPGAMCCAEMAMPPKAESLRNGNAYRVDPRLSSSWSGYNGGMNTHDF